MQATTALEGSAILMVTLRVVHHPVCDLRAQRTPPAAGGAEVDAADDACVVDIAEGVGERMILAHLAWRGLGRDVERHTGAEERLEHSCGRAADGRMS